MIVPYSSVYTYTAFLYLVIYFTKSFVLAYYQGESGTDSSSIIKPSNGSQSPSLNLRLLSEKLNGPEELRAVKLAVVRNVGSEDGCGGWKDEKDEENSDPSETGKIDYLEEDGEESEDENEEDDDDDDDDDDNLKDDDDQDYLLPLESDEPEEASSAILAEGLESEEVKKRSGKKKLVCYYGSWATYRKGDAKFPVEKINPLSCTHIIYSMFGLNGNNQIRSLDPWNDLAKPSGLGSLKKLVALKKKNPELKAMIAIGGWNEGSEKYSKMAATKSSRAIFIKSVLAFLSAHKLDGLDVDWEYPASRGGSGKDKKNFVLLLQELKKAFAKKKYILSAAVAVGKRTIDSAYNIPQLSKALDMINLMTYDYHGTWESKTGLNAPLKDESSDHVMWSVDYWIKNGADPSKIMLGIGLYGRTFTLKNPTNRNLGAPATGGGTPGPHTQQAGVLAYFELCHMIKSGSWKVSRSPEGSVPYASKGNQWVSFDDEQSIEKKVQYGIRKKVGGFMVWSIEQDDFAGKCGRQRFPLIGAIKRASLGGGGGPDIKNPIITKRPRVKTTKKPSKRPRGSSSTTKRPGNRKRRPTIASSLMLDLCEAGGSEYYPGPTCRHYLNCTKEIQAYEECKEGKRWVQESLSCEKEDAETSQTCYGIIFN